jgi:RimJ/RimL family protein N-acetyltransferase
MSRQTTEVTLPEHRAWLTSTLDRADRVLLVAFAEGTPVGQARLDRTEHGTEVSLTVAPERRGQGFATSILRAVDGHARALGITRLIAEIRVENDTSVRAFKTAGWYGFVIPASTPGFFRCERSLRS